MPRVLLLAYYFPPLGGGGAQRAVSLLHDLPNGEWEVEAVVPQHGRGPVAWGPRDASLGVDVDRVDRVPAGRGAVGRIGAPHRRAFVQALRPMESHAADRLAGGEFDVVLATLSPFGLADAALRLGRRFDVPVVLDLRDPWALDGWMRYRSWVDWRLDLARMRSALGRADLVLANTATARDVLVGQGGALPDRTTVVTNGWSREDFLEADVPEREHPDRLLLVHTGSFHSESAAGRRPWHHRPERVDVRGRTPEPLVAALRRLSPVERSAVDFVHVGEVGEATRATLGRAPEAVRWTGYQPHRRSVGWLIAADALFLPLGGVPDGRRSRIVPGKTYEYLAAGRPVLAAVPPGESRELAGTVPGAQLVPPTDIGALTHALRSLIDAKRAGTVALAGRSLRADQYERRAIASGLRDRLTELLERGPG